MLIGMHTHRGEEGWNSGLYFSEHCLHIINSLQQRAEQISYFSNSVGRISIRWAEPPHCEEELESLMSEFNEHFDGEDEEDWSNECILACC